MKKSILALLALVIVQPIYADTLDFKEAERIAIQNGGRKKPLSTFAAETLQTVTGRRTFKDPKTGEKMSATEVVVSIWTAERNWKEIPTVLVADASIKTALGLPTTDKLFSYQQLLDNKQLSEFQRVISEKSENKQELSPLEKEAEIVIDRLELLHRVLIGQALTVVPNPNDKAGNWVTVPGARKLYGAGATDNLNASFEKLAAAYKEKKADAFSAAALALRNQLFELAPANYPAIESINREIHYNDVHPFRLAWVIYFIAFFFVLSKRTYKVGLGIFTAGFALNLYGFILRAMIAGRAPVTNMYESVVWAALGVVLFALIFEFIYKARYFAIAAAPMAVLGLILADMLPTVLNPNITPLPPVLRDNFWLVTHVITIMLGYAAFALAFALAHIVLGIYLLKPKAADENSFLHLFLYRALQIGVLFLAAGTILGGVWANYSWGRFWGWDPKETWALIALLLYIFALHGKIAGWWGNFGMAVASAISFNGVLFAWYGVNFVLGTGLHSYGFGGGGVQYVAMIVGLDALFVIGCIIAHYRRQKKTTFPDGDIEKLNAARI